MPVIFPKEFGDALITMIRNKVPDMEIDGLGVDQVDWARALINEPGYIMDPWTELPQVKMQFVGMASQIGESARLDTVYEYSIFYFRKQTKGEAHQELLVADTDKLFEVFSNNPNLYQPVEFALIGIGPPEQVQVQTVYPFEIKFHQELRHTIDYPNIRVSVSEIRVRIVAFSWAR